MEQISQGKLDFSTARDGAVFWSGPNMRTAQQWAIANGKTTLEQTSGGRYLDSLNLFGNESGMTGKQAAEIWDSASVKFAEGASGNVHVFGTGAKKMNDFGSVRTWWRIEKPALMKNKEIDRVIRLKKDGTPSKNGHISKCRGG
jgi:hypothetical protein